MKLRLLYSLLLMLPLTVAAQLKVNSNGHTSFLTTANPLSPISINDAGDSDYTVYCKSLMQNSLYCENNGKYGIHILNNADSLACSSTAVRMGIYSISGKSSGSTMIGRNVGVLGYARRSYQSFGVVGRVGSTVRGAGIYGCSNSTYHIDHYCPRKSVNILANLHILKSLTTV